jgi:hypothetical protein
MLLLVLMSAETRKKAMNENMKVLKTSKVDKS